MRITAIPRCHRGLPGGRDTAVRRSALRSCGWRRNNVVVGENITVRVEDHARPVSRDGPRGGRHIAVCSRPKGVNGLFPGSTPKKRRKISLLKGKPDKPGTTLTRDVFSTSIFTTEGAMLSATSAISVGEKVDGMGSGARGGRTIRHLWIRVVAREPMQCAQPNPPDANQSASWSDGPLSFSTDTGSRLEKPGDLRYSLAHNDPRLNY